MDHTESRDGTDEPTDDTRTTPAPASASPSGSAPASGSASGSVPASGPAPASGSTPASGSGCAPEHVPEPESAPTPGPTPAPGPTPEPRSAPDPAPQPTPGPQPQPAPESAKKRRRPWVRRVRRAVLVLALVLIVPLVAVETALRVNYMGDPADGTYTRDRDAMWLGHAWVDGRKKDADVTALAGRLKDTGVRDLYVHTGPLEHDGTLPRSVYPRARWFIDAVHRELPGVRVQAFLGDVLANGGPEGLELSDAATRAEVVRSAGQVLDTGYEGVHLDLEPLHSGDGHYLDLLDDLRRLTKGRDAQLSVAAHQIDPLPHLHSVAGFVADHPKWWSQEFFGQVARRVDQIAVMSYDTARLFESTYGGYVAQQTSLALEVTPPTTHLLMGLPFYYESNPSHWGHAETVGAAVRGARLGLSRTDPDRELFGLAPYIDFAATETNWREFKDGWVR